MSNFAIPEKKMWSIASVEDALRTMQISATFFALGKIDYDTFDRILNASKKKYYYHSDINKLYSELKKQYSNNLKDDDLNINIKHEKCGGNIKFISMGQRDRNGLSTPFQCDKCHEGFWFGP